MWTVLVAIFWTAVVCVFIIIAPLLGVIMTAGTIFYVVYEAVKAYKEDED
jgi:ABC-type Fe3+ transport system permease subunit